MDIDTVLNHVLDELERADNWPPYNSAHEGYAIILEEMDELKQHVWTNQHKRDVESMRREAAQVAACAIRFMRDLDDFKV